MLLWSNYLLFFPMGAWRFCLCCPLNTQWWAHNIGFPMPSMAKNLTPFNGPPHRNIAPRLPCFFSHNCWPSLLGTFYFAHQILFQKKILDLLLLSKLCGIFHGILAICLVRREQSDILGEKKNNKNKKTKTPPSLCETHLAHQCPSLASGSHTQP